MMRLLAERPVQAARLAVANNGSVAQSLLLRPGSIGGLMGLAPGETRVPAERLVVERSLSINTAAAGGNASSMSIA